MDQPTVSIVITSYNQLVYLKEAVGSAMTQSTRPHEIIVADDCSTDGSREYLLDLQEENTGWIKIVLNEQNIGISRNRNSGLRIVTGKYVSILDGDDRYLPDFIAVLSGQLNKSSSIGCVYSNVHMINFLGERIGLRDHEVQPSGNIHYDLCLGKMGFMRSMIAPTELIRELGMFDPNYPKHDGYILSLQLATRTRFAYVTEPLAEYRVHERGDSKTIEIYERFKYLQDVFEKVKELSSQLDIKEQEIIQSVWFYRLKRMKMRAEWADRNYLVAFGNYLSAVFSNPKHIYNFYLLRSSGAKHK